MSKRAKVENSVWKMKKKTSKARENEIARFAVYLLMCSTGIDFMYSVDSVCVCVVVCILGRNLIHCLIMTQKIQVNQNTFIISLIETYFPSNHSQTLF